jgi:N-acetyl-gamma-glutamyl-phosphate reductase
MIKAGIKNGETSVAGELLRLLINHPDIDEMWISSHAHVGMPITDLHRGMDGEIDLRFSDDDDQPDDLDVLFDCADADAIFVTRLTPKVDDLGPLIYGIPELERKPLVRGARRAVTADTVVTASALGLLPLAKNLLLDSAINIKINLPEFVNVDVQKSVTHLRAALQTLQLNFSADINISIVRTNEVRIASAEIEVINNVDKDSLHRMFDEFYDDHNFTFVINHRPEAANVANTNKCLIYMTKDGDKLTLNTMIDARLKGSAGTAIHAMNLLFGLHERVGLALKASVY